MDWKLLNILGQDILTLFHIVAFLLNSNESFVTSKHKMYSKFSMSEYVNDLAHFGSKFWINLDQIRLGVK